VRSNNKPSRARIEKATTRSGHEYSNRMKAKARGCSNWDLISQEASDKLEYCHNPIGSRMLEEKQLTSSKA